MKNLRKWIESIVYAGLKPGGPSVQPVQAETWVTRLRQRVDRWLAGDAKSLDPLYVSNRSTAQKIKSWSVVAIPVLILVGGVGLSLSSYLNPNPQEVQRPKEPTPAELAVKMLPNLKDLQIESSHDLEIVEVRVDTKSSPKLVGSVRNKTTHTVASGDINCELTDGDGTQLGAVVVHVENVAPSSVKQFEHPVNVTGAAFVLVRNISTR